MDDGVTRLISITKEYDEAEILPPSWKSYNTIIRGVGQPPMSEPKEDLLAAAGDRVGDALRSVASYHEKEHELQYLRDDIAESYSEDEINEVFHELVLSGIGRDYLEGIFHAGRIECMILGFEEAVMFHFAADATSGRFVSIDRDVDLNLDEFISTCKAVIQA